MNYYKRHLGDYAKNTRTLTTYEHGVYNLVLDLYYTDEAPVSTSDAYAICRADSAKDRAAVDKVLTKFFVPDGDSWSHPRADEEIAKYREKSEKNKEIGSLGGKQKAKRIASETLSESLSESVDKRLANDNPSHKPLAREEKELKAPAPPADFRSDLFRRWKELDDGGGGAFLNALFRDHKPEQRVLEAVERTLDEARADPKAFVKGLLRKESKVDDEIDLLMRMAV